MKRTVEALDQTKRDRQAAQLWGLTDADAKQCQRAQLAEIQRSLKELTE
jgi:hypothetical protein